MKIIQLGITLSNTNGQTPLEPTWQFNFAFSLENDRHQPEAISLLKEAGIDFARLGSEGIHPLQFLRHFSMSGLCSNGRLTWLAFNSKFDFAYLLSLFCRPLPSTKPKFLHTLTEFCPRYYDVKHLGQGSLGSQLAQEGIIV